MDFANGDLVGVPCSIQLGPFADERLVKVETNDFGQLNSNRLARRFAHLTSTYLDHPDEAKTPAARVPIENVFRLLQMLRYNAFADERRSGVLELQSFGDRSEVPTFEDQWHDKIQAALEGALAYVFGATPPEQAFRELEASLTWLATNANEPTGEVRARTKSFLQRFLERLA